jgi:hypothetical protein
MINNILKQIEEEILQKSTEIYIGSGSDLVINTKHAIGIAKSSIIKVLEQLVEREEKLLNKPNPQELLFGDCPNCGQEVNRKWISNKVTEIHDEAKQETIDYLKSEIAILSTNID